MRPPCSGMERRRGETPGLPLRSAGEHVGTQNHFQIDLANKSSPFKDFKCLDTGICFGNGKFADLSP